MEKTLKNKWFWIILIAVIILIYGYNKGWFSKTKKYCCGGVIEIPSLNRMASGMQPECTCADGIKSFIKPGTKDCLCPENNNI